MLLAAAGRAKGERRLELRLRAVPEISETQHIPRVSGHPEEPRRGPWPRRGGGGASKCPHFPIRSPRARTGRPPTHQGIAHELPALQLPRKAT